MSKRGQKNYLTLMIKIAISCAIISVLVYQTANDPDVLELVQKPKRWEWFFLALVAQLVGYTLSHVRWWILANAVQVQLSLWNSIRIGFIALAFHLIAFGVAGGDILRAFYVCRDHPEKKPYAVSSVVLDRGVGLLTMFFCVSLASFFIDWDSLASATDETGIGLSNGISVLCVVARTVTVCGVIGMLGMMILGGPRWAPAIKTRAGRLPAGKILTSILDVFTLYRSRPLSITLSLVMSLGVVCCLTFCVYCLAQGLTELTPTLPQHFIITPISLIAGAVPLPMGIGSQELAMSLLYKWFSTAELNADYGLLVAIGYRLITFLMMGFGVLLYFSQGRKDRELMDAAAQSPEMADAG